MKALVYTGPEQLEVRDMPMPEPAAGEVLVKVDSVGICGSDMHAFLGHDARRPAPLILGHEAAGVIVSGPRQGDRVTINPLVTCGICTACRQGRENLCPNRQIISMQPRQGAFAEFVAMPERNLIAVPDHVPLGTAALAEPLAVSWHAVRLALDAVWDAGSAQALVIGGGAIGVAAGLALQAMGAPDVTILEPNAVRRNFLSRLNGISVTEQNEGAYDLVIDAVGYAATRALASALVNPGGVIAHIGLGEDEGGLDIRRMTLQEVTFIGTYTYTAQDFQDTAQAMFAGKLAALDWAESRPLDAGAEAFDAIRSGEVAAPKIILRPQ